MTPSLYLYFLGSPRIELNDQPITLDRRKMVALLAHLSVERGQHQRASLSSLLWSDYEQAKAYKNLRQTLWEIQRTLGENWLDIDRETIGLNHKADIQLDVENFNSLVEKSRAESDPSLRTALLAESATLYRNHFLTGFSLKDAHPFDEWAFSVSEELKRKLSYTLTSLAANYCSLGHADQAISYARRLVALDPLNEGSHRQLMEAYMQAGQQNAALKQYQTLEQTLRQELNLDPQPETRDLYKKIRKGEMKPLQEQPKEKTTVKKHNLSHPVSKFIGREREMKEIKNMLKGNRLVTLVGAGGIGKTSLSLQLGRSLTEMFADGVWFIALDALSDPPAVAKTTADVFNIKENHIVQILSKLNEYLQTKHALLIFDNCEHLLDACAELISTLLGHCPNIRVLATSREGLGISGEAVYTMPSLPIPEAGMDLSLLDVQTNYESINLFAERAKLALASFELTKDNIEAVARICCHLDGIPLAIELAAARVNILQVNEILEQLLNSFSLLTNNGRTILPRHQTLQASIEWSWDLLSESERIFLCQLSVFSGGWTFDAAQSICDGDVLGLTDALVKKSLIIVNQEAGRATRYFFHEMVRNFVQDKCRTLGTEQEIRTHHLRYFLDLSEKAETGLRGPVGNEWIELLDIESHNFQSALQWADQTNVQAGLRIASRLARYWEFSNLRGGIHWLERFIQNPTSNGFLNERARALFVYGWLLTWLQQFANAQSALEESLALFRSFGDQRGETDALTLFANVKQFLDKPAEADELLNQALVLSRALKDEWREANVNYYLGWDRRYPSRAAGYWEKALVLYQKTNDRIAQVNTLGILGLCRVVDGKIDIGEKCLNEANRLWETYQQKDIWQNPQVAKSLIALSRGDSEQANALLEEAITAVRGTSNRVAYYWLRARQGCVSLRTGKLEQAQDILLETAQNFISDGYMAGAIFAIEGLAGVYVEKGMAQQAVCLIGWIEKTREEADTHVLLEQDELDIIKEICMTKLGESAYHAAHEEGSRMTLNEVINLVQKLS
jgi:predicted ATPase